MIHLTLPDGDTVAINPLTIFAVKPASNGSVVIGAGGAMVVVKETVAEIDRAVMRWTKGD